MQIKMISRWQNGEPKKCALCTALSKRLGEVLEELGLSGIAVEECSSQQEYDSYGIFIAPLLIINGKVKLAGRVPPREMLREFIKFELTRDTPR
jgi:hypothetical protein